MTTKEKVQRLQEDSLKKNVIIPLMKSYCCFSVRDWHGTSERGIDVLYKKENTFNELVYRGILIKAVKISKPILRGNVEPQIKDAIDISFPNPDNPKDIINIHELIVVTNKDITPDARNDIRDLSKAFFPSIEIVDGDRLCDLIERIICNHNEKQSKKSTPNFYDFGVNTFKMFCENYYKQFCQREFITSYNAIYNHREGGVVE